MTSLAASDLKTLIGSRNFEESQDFYLALGWQLNYPVCYLNSTPEWSRLKAAILRFTRVLSDKNVFT